MKKILACVNKKGDRTMKATTLMFLAGIVACIGGLLCFGILLAVGAGLI